jgi:hypothetical protein
MLRRNLLPALAALCVIASIHIAAQQPASAPAASAKDAELRLLVPHHDPVSLTTAEFKAMPHLSVTIHNSHSNADETYSGVRLVALLGKIGAPLGAIFAARRSLSTLLQAAPTDTRQFFP